MDLPARQPQSMLQPKPQLQAGLAAEPIAVGLNAAILAVHSDEPVVAVVPARREVRDGEAALPCGLFSPRQHDSLEAALRSCVEHQTGIELGSARQICTLGGRHGTAVGDSSPRLPIVAVCYLALVDPSRVNDRGGASWCSWYDYFPWEDWRRGTPACLTEEIEPRLKAWARLIPAHCEASAPRDRLDRSQRLRIAFGCDGAAWDEEKALDRYDLLCEAGILGEAGAGAGNAVPASWR